MDTREPTRPSAFSQTPEASGGGPSGTTAGMKNEVKTLLQDAKQETSRLADTARERAAETAASRKDAAADRIGSVAGALRDAGTRLDRDDTGFGRYAQTAAEQADRLAQYLRRSDVGGMVRDAETFARRHPELFLGAAFLGGMVAARFLKSSPPKQQAAAEPSYPSGYGAGYAGGYGYQAGAPYNPAPTPFNPPRTSGPGGTSGTGGGDL